MPKEYIEDRDTTRYEGDDSNAGSPFRIKVGWSKEHGDFQIATVAPDGFKLESEHPESNGWFVNLDRSGINHLIRTLRKARDQAFGADA